MPSLGDLVVNLSANTRGLQSGLKRSESSLKRFSSAARTAATAVAGYLSVRAVVDMAAAAREQVQAEKKLAAVIKATGGAAGVSAKEIQKLAGELQQVTNFGDEVTISAAAVLATFKNIKGDAFREALVAAQDMSSVMGTDMQSSITQIGKALNDPIAGMTALSRAGVTFSTQQKEQVRLLQESGNIVAAQAIVLKELQSQFGGASEAMADPWIQLSNKLGDVKEVFGQITLDLTTQLLPAINDVLDAMMELPKLVNIVRLAFNDMSFDALIAKERVRAFFGDDVAQLRIQSFEKQRRDMEDQILGLNRGGEEIINATEMESIWRNMQGPLGAALAGAVGSGAISNLVAGDSLVDQAMQMTSNSRQRGVPATGAPGGDMRFAAANERGSSAALSTILSAGNEQRRAEREMLAQLKKHNEMLAQGIKVFPPEGQSLEVVEDLT